MSAAEARLAGSTRYGFDRDAQGARWPAVERMSARGPTPPAWRCAQRPRRCSRTGPAGSWSRRTPRAATSGAPGRRRTARPRDDLVKALADRVAGEPVRGGAGNPATFDRTSAGRCPGGSRYALQVCRLEGWQHAGVRRPRHLSVAALAWPTRMRCARSPTRCSAPLDAYDERPQRRPGHVTAVRSSSTTHGGRSAAGELYVHRHTLRYRMRKVEELTGRDLSNAAFDRMEFCSWRCAHGTCWQARPRRLIRTSPLSRLDSGLEPSRATLVGGWSVHAPDRGY